MTPLVLRLWYLIACEQAAAALAEPAADLDDERRVIAEAQQAGA